MYDKIRIAPSILSGDFMDMAQSIDQIEAAGAQWVHIDVMDGHFVPNLTMGVPFVAQARKITDLPLDVHLMITNPLVQIPWFIEPISSHSILKLQQAMRSIARSR